METSALPAQYGYHSSAAVNAVTKSVTNDLHGDVFGFLRNGDLKARKFFATSRDTIKRNQFGGIVGGRIIKVLIKRPNFDCNLPVKCTRFAITTRSPSFLMKDTAERPHVRNPD